MPKTIAYRIIDQISVLVHGLRPPTQDEFDAYLGYLAALPPPIHRSMIITPGPGPNAKQRAQMNEILQKRGQENAKVAVVTDATIARGIVTAMGWFNRNMKVFSNDRIYDAIRYLDDRPEVASHVLIEIRKMQAEIE
jgi:hypothetical protein